MKKLSGTQTSRLSNDDVQSEIERMILGGELESGQHIREHALSKRLGIGRGPIREACRALHGAHLVDIQPNRGVFVREVSLDEALDVFEIRAALARVAAVEAANHVSRQIAAELYEMVEAMEGCVRSGDVDDYLSRNMAFHDRIFVLSGNDRLRLLEAGLSKELLLFRHHALVAGGQLDARNAEHRDIVAALAAGDGSHVADLLEDHIRRGKARLLAALGDS